MSHKREDVYNEKWGCLSFVFSSKKSCCNYIAVFEGHFCLFISFSPCEVYFQRPELLLWRQLEWLAVLAAMWGYWNGPLWSPWTNLQGGGPALFSFIAQWRKQWIREIEVFKKCPKVNPYCNAIFYPILFKPFLDGAKWPKFCAKYFSLLKKSNIGCIFFIFLWNIVKGWLDHYEIYTMYASCH